MGILMMGLTVTDTPIYDSMITESYEDTPIYDALIDELYPPIMITLGDDFRDKYTDAIMKITVSMNRFGKSIQDVMKNLDIMRAGVGDEYSLYSQTRDHIHDWEHP